MEKSLVKSKEKCIIEGVQGSRQTDNLKRQFEDFLQIDFNKKTRERKPCYSFGIRLSLNKLVKPNNSEAFLMSKLQKQIGNLIRNQFVNFTVQENIRPEWMTSSKGERLELDFFISDLSLAFEIQGQQHYQFIEHFHNSIEEFNNQTRRDLEKKSICQNRSITLIEIASPTDYELNQSTIKQILNNYFQQQKETYILSKVAQELIAYSHISLRIQRSQDRLLIESNKQTKGSLKHKINIDKRKREASAEHIRYLSIKAMQEFDGVLFPKGIERKWQQKRQRLNGITKRKQRRWI